MVALAKIPRLMSTDEFIAWNAGDGQTWQLVDGEPQAMAPTSRTHGALMTEVGRLLGNHLAERGRPCTALTQPGIVPRANAARNFRIPDLAVTCTGYDTEEYAVADPVLIVEILSPSNKAKTWANVWSFTTIPSVQEILILHSDAIGAELLRRLPDGTWPPDPQAIATGELHLDSIDFRVALPALYRTTRLASPGDAG
jgi:Uma2 family endonuclease